MEGVEQRQVKILEGFPTIFRRPFPGCTNHLDAVKFDCFQSFDEVSSATFCLICGAAYSVIFADITAPFICE